MKFATTLLALASISIQSVLARTRIRECGSVITLAQKKTAEAHFNAHKAAARTRVGAVDTSTPLNVYWHVVTQGDGYDDGNISDQAVVDQITVLNDDFAPLGFSFNLVNISRTNNSDWFNYVYPDNTEANSMKQTLRVGGPLDLNLYSVGFATSGLLGYSTFPFWYADTPWDDGVVVLYSSLPGGTAVPYDLGKTLTHEVGHWVGLYHTFQDGCDGGDLVDDTPPEAGPVFGCPTSSDTCPQPGSDPFHNFMDYSDDNCMTEFSPGQAARALDQMVTYRYAA